MTFTTAATSVLLALGLGGCGIYQNHGRKTFESRSQGQLRSNVGLSQFPGQLHPCWKQSANDPLWPVDKNLKISVKRIENNQLLICAEEAS